MAPNQGAEPRPAVPDPEREVRFGLVLYGGVSLAVYIYGVAYEFQRLVRASQGVERNAWTEVLRASGVSATVDIVSGASAGGINGVLLGKALTLGADLRAVRSLWIDDADLGQLLREAGEKEPKSLLKSARFRELLESGLAKMDQQSVHRRLVSAFDLFVAGTRLRPWVRDFPTDLGGTIRTSDYRKSFNLKFRRRGYNPVAPDLGYARNDFLAEQNATLAQVAQATSAFPVAFEPVEIEQGKANEHLFSDGEPTSSYFSDGGILHNKPFTETISTILNRAAGRPVDRWLVSVEPDPEHTVPTAVNESEPEVSEVASKAVLGIPRYQSIAADLAALQERRVRVSGARAKLAGIDEALLSEISERDKEDLSVYRDSVLVAANYHDERRRRFSEFLAGRLTAGWSEPAKPLAQGRISVALDSLEGDAFADADPEYERRRIYRLLELVRPLLADPESGAKREEIGEQKLRLWATFDRIDQLLWETFEEEAGWPESDEAAGFSSAPAGDLVERLRRGLAPVREEARAACEILDRLWLAVHGRRGAERFTAIFDWFELWDVQLLTIAELSDTAARDEIRLARISPADAQYIERSPAAKLAGDALGHFGGFLKRDWRRNDVLWGRLDAAETISRILIREARDPALLEQQIRIAQEEVVHDELPDVKGDYRSYMENEHSVGAETMADVPMEDRTGLALQAADVFRNMLRGLENADAHGATSKLFGWLGRAVGLVLFFLRWPVRAVWGRDPAVRRGANLAVLFIGLWSIASLLLIALDAIGTTSTLWTLTLSGLAIFAIWSILQSLSR